MKTQIIAATIAASCVALGCMLVSQGAIAGEAASVEVAFSPDGGAEQLVLHAIDRAQHSIRVMAYEFTAMPVVRALLLARRRGVDVAVTVDYRANIEDDRSGSSHAALDALVYVGIPVRTVRAFPILHSKYLIIDSAAVETGSYNFTQQAARYNSENALLIEGSAIVAQKYLCNWQDVSAQGDLYHAP